METVHDKSIIIDVSCYPYLPYCHKVELSKGELSKDDLSKKRMGSLLLNHTQVMSWSYNVSCS